MASLFPPLTTFLEEPELKILLLDLRAKDPLDPLKEDLEPKEGGELVVTPFFGDKFKRLFTEESDFFKGPGGLIGSAL